MRRSPAMASGWFSYEKNYLNDHDDDDDDDSAGGGDNDDLDGD